MGLMLSQWNLIRWLKDVHVGLDPKWLEDSNRYRWYFCEIEIPYFECTTSKLMKHLSNLKSLIMKYLSRMALIMANSIRETPIKIMV